MIKVTVVILPFILIQFYVLNNTSKSYMIVLYSVYFQSHLVCKGLPENDTAGNWYGKHNLI